MTHPKALIALSGGVDSAVAAFLTQQEGFTCAGATMRLYDPARLQLPPAPDGATDAAAVAQRLNIPFYLLDFTESFHNLVIGDFIDCYQKGLTPNPCVRCNRALKFGSFLSWALENGFDYVVTGHYAEIFQYDSGRFGLKKAADMAKDQSYFLCGLTQDQLSHVRFPLGAMTKQEARQIAEAQGFLNARKRDSQDICFIPDGDCAAFLHRCTGMDAVPGDYLDLQGNVVGRHTGAISYTLGQRKGLGLAMGAPVYVCAKDMSANTVTVGPNEALFHKSLRGNDWVWYPFSSLNEPVRVMAKARSRMIEQPATVYPEADGYARVEFDEPQRALTPGQAVVLYDGDLVIGGGTITQIL